VKKYVCEQGNMVLKTSVPVDLPNRPRAVLASMLPQNDDDRLTEQRALSLAVNRQVDALYRQYYASHSHPLVSSETAHWALGKTDHTSLRTTRNESDNWMRRLAEECLNPVPLRAICTWADEDKLTPILDVLKNHPEIKIAVVTNFPHGDASPEDAARQIHRVAELLKGVPNPVEIDTVVNYRAWLNGDVESVRATLQAERQACSQHGFTWKSIQMVSVHAHEGQNTTYGDDFFASVYDLATLCLEEGADCVKTSTGAAAAPPLSYFVKKDIGHMAAALPMLIALRDFNAANSTNRWPKFSGGHRNEADAAAFKLAVDTITPELSDSTVFGAGYRFRQRLLQYLQEQGYELSPKALQPKDLTPERLPAHLTGLPAGNSTRGASIQAPSPTPNTAPEL